MLLLQETYVDNMKLAKTIEQRLNVANCIWNFSKGVSCGVAILVFNKDICIENYHSDFFGRVIKLDFSLDGFQNFRVVNAYFPSYYSERSDFISTFSQYLTGAKNILLGGDFNCILDADLDKIGGNQNKGAVGSKKLKNILEQISLIDCFRHLYPKKRQVTWMRQNVGTRIDRFYLSSLLKGMISDFETVPCSCSDHSFIVLNLTSSGNDAVTFGKSYWKFNNDLLEDENFVRSFRYFWALVSRTTNVTLEWWDRMKEQIRLFCIDYSKGKNKHLYGELKKLKKQYSALDLNCNSDLNVLNAIKEKVKVIETQLAAGSIIRSKANMLDNNENPSSYFFQKEVSQAKEKTVRSILAENVTYSNSHDILKCFRSFYETLYTSEPIDASLNPLFLSNLPQVDNSDNLFLKQDIAKHEILKALKSMEKDKSPGSDGLSSSLYIKFFDIFGDIITQIINLAFNENSLSDSQKLSYITLICKDKSQSNDMKFYRPISLLNIDYKIISKVLSSRLSNVLPKIINADQTCAVKGRSIFDNLHLIRNVIDYVDQKNLQATFICLDQEKAFDRVSWDYLYATLEAFGFHENFIRWVKLLYTDISASVIVNNFISSSFSVNRGVRQGCSLSPLLYVLCFEPFAQKIRSLDDIKGLKLPGSKEQLKLILYADDSNGVFTDDASVHRYFHWVKLFERVSGSKINMRKSKGMYLGKWKDRSDHPFGISWVKNHKILGYIYGNDFTDDDLWSKLFQKFDKTLQLWKYRKLSFKGKSTVLNSLCLNKILYYSAASTIPSHYMTLMQRTCFRFVWNSKYEPLARTTLYLPFLEGGLNIPNLKLKCYSQYLSHLQKLLNNHGAKWTYFAKYWIGLQLKKYGLSFSNSVPHSEFIPPFYKLCLSILEEFNQISHGVSFCNITSKQFYNLLICDLSESPKIKTVCPTINFKSVWENLYRSCIDPGARNTMFLMSHDVIFVNYFLFNKNISRDKSCPICGKTETVSHLFLECSVFLPLNKIVLYILRNISLLQITYSERVFRFFELPTLDRFSRYLALVLLSESRHLIWTSRNCRKHENKNFNSLSIVSAFFNKVKFRILADKKRLPIDDFYEIWLVNGFCSLNLTEDTLTFNDSMKPQFYVQKKIVTF